MIDVLQPNRKYTWGAGTYEYSLYDGKVYCHTTGTWLDALYTKCHVERVPAYERFRYLEGEEVQMQDDDVRQPSHYQVFPDVESIEIIARSMTHAEFKGFCMGNVLKYHLRAGKKSELATMEKDLKKADFYKELFEQHKGKCYG